MKSLRFSIIVFIGSLLILSCYYDWPAYKETRTKLYSTNAIGIAGEAAEEPYIEIRYSVADEEKPGFNKTVSIMVSPPYVFQNDEVYITYEYTEYDDNSLEKDKKYPVKISETLLRNFDEGGAEYLRIINHSVDKPVEFFLAGAISSPEYNPGIRSISVPSVRYKRAPVYFLLFPEYKFFENVVYSKDDIYYFEGDRCGDLILTRAWTVDEVVALYRAEYARSDNIRLVINVEEWRMIDMVNGKISGHESYKGYVFYDTINPQNELKGNEKLWLLATPRRMFEVVIFNGDAE